jgi:hypothetical protein
VTGLVWTRATGFAVDVLTETACACGAAFGPATATGFAEDAETETLFAAEVAFGAEVAGFLTGALTETAAVFGPELAGLAAAEVFTETAATFGTEVAGFPAAAAFAETAFFCATELVLPAPADRTETAFALGVAAPLAALTFAPLGEGFPGCDVSNVPTVTVAGAAGVCAAVGVCATAAADRSMSIPRFRIIYVLPLAVAGVAAGRVSWLKKVVAKQVATTLSLAAYWYECLAFASPGFLVFAT